MVGGAASAKSRLLDAASRLFYEEGMTATGIDTITAAAGVAKQSLYNNFASKDDLMLAYIEARHEEWLGLYRERLAGATTPRERVLAVFDAYIDHARFEYARGFRGCGLLNAAAELPAGATGRDAVRRHKEQVEGLVREPLGELVPDAPRADRLAEHLSFLLEGSMSRAGLEGGTPRLEHARALALDLLDAL
ncbi:TetR/AcrR family transcriptional regulator [Herbiconiux sp. A18JL235]|uniref:TetR/AcrR family transcriptional regulator n=1 Tax=Herbiconiux sp. A18JL235 TaxID=3152363 RepID=A0AB39BI93_9MICO